MSQITWIASYPRSGNTWLRFMLTSYLMNAALTAQETIEDLIPDFHYLVRDGRLRNLIRSCELHNQVTSGAAPADDPSPLLIKTHYLPSAAVMRQCEALAAKAIYIVRNPRDVLLSAARYVGIVPSLDEVSRNWASSFITNRGGVSWSELTGTWPQHVREWTAMACVRQYFPGIEVLAVRYEDMRADPAGKLHQILEFLGLGQAIEPDRVRSVVAESGLARMREFEDVSLERRGISLSSRQHRFVDQGLSGQSLAVFGEDIELAYRRLMERDEEFSRCARRFGYQL